jgi:hypothetical protein
MTELNTNPSISNSHEHTGGRMTSSASTAIKGWRTVNARMVVTTRTSATIAAKTSAATATAPTAMVSAKSAVRLWMTKATAPAAPMPPRTARMRLLFH